MKTRIIVDSTADLMPEIKERVHVVPLTVHFGDEEYIDGVTIDHKTFYEKLIESDVLPTTSQATPDAFMKEFEKAGQAGEAAVVITIASQLSGTYQSAVIAAGEYENIFVVDSGSGAMGSGILTELALRLLDEGKSAEEVAAILEEEKKKIVIVALVDTLEYLKKGGRLNAAVAAVGGMLNIKPLIYVTESGEIKVHGMVRGMKKAFATMTELSRNDGIDEEKPVLLGYTGTSDDNLQKYIAEYAEAWPQGTSTTHVGSTIGVHVGPGVVACAFFQK